jgi:hypothetical protein
MILDSLTNRAEDDSLLGKFILERGLYRHGVHDGIHSCTTQCEALFERNTQFVESLLQFRVYLFVGRLLRQRVGIIGNGLIVYFGNVDMSPRWLLQGCPVIVSLETEVEHPFRFAFLPRDEPHDVFVQPLINDFGMHVGSESELVFLFGYLLDKLVFYVILFHILSKCLGDLRWSPAIRYDIRLQRAIVGRPYSGIYKMCTTLKRGNKCYYNFCCTSMTVKVSMISPSRMSLKLTRLIPHSKPVATSLTSSL